MRGGQNGAAVHLAHGRSLAAERFLADKVGHRQGYLRFSTSEIIRKYSLNSSANVKRVKDALMKKEILTFDADDKPSFLDPLFEYWIKKYYFELPE